MNNFGIEPCFSCENPLDPNPDCEECLGSGRGDLESEDLEDTDLLNFLIEQFRDNRLRNFSFTTRSENEIENLTELEVEFLKEIEKDSECFSCDGSGSESLEEENECSCCNGSGIQSLSFSEASFFLEQKKIKEKEYMNSICYK